MSVFHRVDVEEVEQMPAARYFMLAIRLPAYSGALAARLRAEPAPATAEPDAPAPAAATTEPSRTGVRSGPHPGSAWSFATAGGE